MRKTSPAYSNDVADVELSVVVKAALLGKDPFSYLADKHIVGNSVIGRAAEPVRVHVRPVASDVAFSGKGVHSWMPEEPSQDAFVQLDRQRESTRANDISLLIAISPRLITTPFSERLVARLDVLAQEPEEPGEQPMSPESLRHFLNFLVEWLKETPDLKCPEIAISFAGNIGLEWRGPQGELLGIEFLPNGDTRFVIFARNARYPDRLERLPGIASIGRLRQIMDLFEVLTWCRGG
jgi:hypothetical protein